METNKHSYNIRSREVQNIIITNNLACSFTLLCYLTTVKDLEDSDDFCLMIKTFELVSCELFSFTIAILEIYGESTNSHIHIIIFFYSALDLLFNRKEHSRYLNSTQLFLYFIKSVMIQKSKVLECQISSTEVLPVIRRQIKKFQFSKRTYGRFLWFLCIKDFFIGVNFKLKRQYWAEATLLIINQLSGILPESKIRMKFWTETSSVVLMLLIKGAILTDYVPEPGFAEILTFVVGVIYLFFICLEYVIKTLIFKREDTRPRKTILGDF